MKRNRSLVGANEMIFEYGNEPLALGVIPETTTINSYTQDGFKVLEPNIVVSAPQQQRQTIPTNGVFFSGDRGSAKLVINLFMGGAPFNLSDVRLYEVEFEFIGLNVDSITLTPEITDALNGRATILIPDEILAIGNTNVNQHVRLIRNDGRYLDLGVFRTRIEQSFNHVDLVTDIWTSIPPGKQGKDDPSKRQNW